MWQALIAQDLQWSVKCLASDTGAVVWADTQISAYLELGIIQSDESDDVILVMT